MFVYIINGSKGCVAICRKIYKFCLKNHRKNLGIVFENNLINFLVNAGSSVLDYRPSTVATAAILAASNERLTKELVESKINNLSLSGYIEKVYISLILFFPFYNRIKNFHIIPESIILFMSFTGACVCLLSCHESGVRKESEMFKKIGISNLKLKYT